MWNEMSNPAVLVKIGQRIKETRIRQHITQEELGNGFRCKPLDRCEHRERQIGIAAVVHQCTSFTRPFGEPGTTGTGNPDQPDRTQKTAREKTLPCTPFKTR
mgnify:CR=1 FL=1